MTRKRKFRIIEHTFDIDNKQNKDHYYIIERKLFGLWWIEFSWPTITWRSRDTHSGFKNYSYPRFDTLEEAKRALEREENVFLHEGKRIRQTIDGDWYVDDRKYRHPSLSLMGDWKYTAVFDTKEECIRFLDKQTARITNITEL